MLHVNSEFMGVYQKSVFKSVKQSSPLLWLFIQPSNRRLAKEHGIELW